MGVRVVRLGSPREPGEGLRLGTVRRPPRGVAKADFARLDYYDLWLPTLAPSAALLAASRAAAGGVAGDWPRFSRQFLAEMRQPDAAHLLNLLAALSHRTDFSVGCYCADEHFCHRSLLAGLLRERGAIFASPGTGETGREAG
jgi:uncharacterized protein YeaO (DUF488 family)